jgi:carbon storage regulator CsrA
MLVLTRKKSEAIHIGDDITIKVIDVRGKTVRLGIEAPGHVSILRAELIPGTVEVSVPCELIVTETGKSESVPAIGGV